MSDFLGNAVCLDWIGLSTYKSGWSGELDKMVAGLIPIVGSPTSQDSKVAQYEGKLLSWSVGQIFVGEGINGGRMHTICQLQGYVADVANDAGLVRLEFWGVNRVDIQCTVPYLGTTARSMLPDGESRKSYRIFEGNSGLDTVYVGSKSSEKFWRVYDKLDSSGDRWKRFEIQLSRQYVKGRGREILADYEKLFIGLVGRLQRKNVRNGVDMGAEFDELMRCIVDKEGITMKSLKRGKNNTLEWLRDAVMPGLCRLMKTGYMNEVIAFHDALAENIYRIEKEMEKSELDKKGGQV